MAFAEEERLKSRRERRRPGWRSILPAAMVICALAVAGIVLLMPEPVREERGDHRLRYQYEGTIEVDGVQYRLRRRITSILLLGIDRTLDEPEREGYFNGGMADFQRLLVIDAENARVSQIQIDRDTMTPVTIVGPLGDELGQAMRQICIAHSYGDGREQSGDFAVRAVSGLLMGVPIDFYVSLRMDAIGVLNDQVGGVAVTLEDDLTNVDPAFQKGATVTLHGDQAVKFVRARMSVGDGTNTARMRRQQQFVSALSEKVNQRVSADKNYIGGLYDALSDYMVTDLSRGRAINEAWNARRFERAALIEIPGTHTVNEKDNMEFHADEKAIRDIVLDLFYEPVK